MSTRKITLKGMTWDHSRGFTPMAATAQRFHELHPEVEILWDKRSLQEFADKPIADLAATYDLLVIDHPWAGFASRSGVLMDLNKLLPAEFMADQAANSVGKSHASYQFDGGQWALAIDAATPVSAYRPDVLEAAGKSLPKTWDDVIDLGRAGLVCCPSIPLDVYGNFLNLCASAGESIFPDREIVVEREAGLVALERLRGLAAVVPERFFAINPIRACEAMTLGDEFGYCPFTYGYSNYSRPGYARKLLRFGGIAEVAPGRKPTTMLGGTGLAISSHSQHPDIAAEYAAFVAAGETQRGLFYQNGGQPGHRTAWTDAAVNASCANYFRDTLETLDLAFVRPRYAGYLDFQDHAGDPIHAYLREGGDPAKVLDTVNQLYRESLSA